MRSTGGGALANSGYTATFAEFPGCIACGATAAEAVASLDGVFPDFIAVMLENGAEVPAPLLPGEYSGRLTFRITPSLHAAAARRAALEGASLNRLLAEAVARYVGPADPAPPASPGHDLK